MLPRSGYDSQARILQLTERWTDLFGAVLADRGRYKEAEEMHRRELRLSETVLGNEHPSTLTSMNNPASMLSDHGKYEQAEEIHRQALRLSETVLGNEHPDTLMSLNNLAGVLSRQGKYEQAEKCIGKNSG